MNRKELEEHLHDFPLQAVDVLRAVVAVIGLAETLATLGELFGNAGQNRRRARRRTKR